MGALIDKFVFVIEPGFTMQAFSSAVEVLRLAKKFGGQDRFDYAVAGAGKQPISASNGIEVLPTLSLDDVPRRCAIVIVSGAHVTRQENPQLIAKIRSWDRRGLKLWGISSGVVRLAQAGLLDNEKVAPHWEDVPYLAEAHPRVVLSTELYVLNARHPTCAGGGAAADLMLSYVRETANAGLVAEITSRLMMDGVRDGRMLQNYPTELRFATSNRMVFNAIRLMIKTRYDAIPLREVAERLALSQRQLERLFRAEFGKSPGEVYMQLRMDEARQEVLSARRPLSDIALDYGFQPAHFAKVYRRIFGSTPSQDRKVRE